MVFQWFPMVGNHCSNDGMVTIHRRGLITTIVIIPDLAGQGRCCRRRHNSHIGHGSLTQAQSPPGFDCLLHRLWHLLAYHPQCHLPRNLQIQSRSRTKLCQLSHVAKTSRTPQCQVHFHSCTVVSLLHFLFRMFLFHVLNPDQVSQGQKPELEQVLTFNCI